MKVKLLILLHSIYFFTACSSGDDDCSFPNLSGKLYLEFIDTEGNNLLQNGYYSPQEVVITVNGTVIGGITSINDKILYVIPQSGAESRNGDDYEVKLSTSETDTMKIFYSTEYSCQENFYIVQRVSYNGEERGILYFEGHQKINVMKDLLSQ